MQGNRSDYFHVALSTSLVIFGFHKDQLQILLSKKADAPFEGAPYLPTKWVEPNKEIDAAASALLIEAIGPNEATIEQLNAFSKLYREPEGRVVNIAQMSLVQPHHIETLANSSFYWSPICSVPTLIYDHNEILAFAKERLKRRIGRRPVGFNLLAREFSLRNIHSLYEQGLNKKLDRRNFYKKLINSDLLVDTEKTRRENSSKKPSKLYSFNEREYSRLSLRGYDLKF